MGFFKEKERDGERLIYVLVVWKIGKLYIYHRVLLIRRKVGLMDCDEDDDNGGCCV